MSGIWLGTRDEICDEGYAACTRVENLLVTNRNGASWQIMCRLDICQHQVLSGFSVVGCFSISSCEKLCVCDEREVCFKITHSGHNFPMQLGSG